jgi:hypothetical protein
MRGIDAMLFLVALAIVANVLATVRVLRDTLSEPRQRAAQIAFVWFVPFIGAVFVWFFLSNPKIGGGPRYPADHVAPDTYVDLWGGHASSDHHDSAGHDGGGNGH